jgi:hypothetical protein
VKTTRLPDGKLSVSDAGTASARPAGPRRAPGTGAPALRSLGGPTGPLVGADLDRTHAITAAAFELGLVDELRMFRHPVVVGGGTPLLPPVTEQILLDLIETRTFSTRVIYERYRRGQSPSRGSSSAERDPDFANPRLTM